MQIDLRPTVWWLGQWVKLRQGEERLGRYIPYKEPPTPITPRNRWVDLFVQMALTGAFK